MSTGWIIFIVILAGLGVGGFVIRNKIREYSLLLFGTENFKEGIQQNRFAKSEMPKSLNGMDSIYLPQILRDFPDFNLQEFITKAENSLTAVLNAIEALDVDLLKGVSTDFYHKTENIIEDLMSRNEREVYDAIRIHRTVISQYRKRKGLCVITLQTAIEYYYQKYRNEVMVDGSKEFKTQERYEIELIYIQDLDQLESKGIKETAMAVNCPNCGAPVKTLGTKYCIYCGSAIQEIHMKVWEISDYRRA